jgi:hypothetical protein
MMVRGGAKESSGVSTDPLEWKGKKKEKKTIFFCRQCPFFSLQYIFEF